MKEQIDASRFRREFKQLDDTVLLSTAHVAALMGQTENAVYVMKSRGQLPRPAIERRKNVRWTAGQIRAWVAGLASGVADGNTRAPTRTGRPRLPAKPTPLIEGGAAATHQASA